MTLPFAVVALVLAATSPKTERPKLLVLDMAATETEDAKLAAALTGAVVAELNARGYFEVISSREILVTLGLERQKQLLGCSDEASTCNAELAGALGTRLVLSGTLSRLGDAYQLTLQLIDNERQRALHRSTRLAKSRDVLRVQVIYAVAEATGSPLPPPPSKAPSWTLIGAGVAFVIAGLSVGVFTISSELSTNAELEQGRSFPQVLKPYDYYVQQSQRAGLFRSLALAGLCAGAVMIGLGIWFWPPDLEASSSLKVALYSTGNSLGLAGAF